jgi:hypothetical protein
MLWSPLTIGAKIGAFLKLSFGVKAGYRGLAIKPKIS